MSGLDLARNELQLGECNSFSEPIDCPATELEQILRGKMSDGIVVAWQVQSVVWGTFDGEKILLKENVAPNVDDWLECRIFNESAEIHIKRTGKNFVGRFVRDAAGNGTFYVDSFSRLWGKCTETTDAWITLTDKPRKISMTIPCANAGKKFYGLTTRNYIGNDAATGLSGYVDYRFVAIEPADWDGD